MKKTLTDICVIGEGEETAKDLVLNLRLIVVRKGRNHVCSSVDKAKAIQNQEDVD